MHQAQRFVVMMKKYLILLFFILMLHGCGGADEEESAKGKGANIVVATSINNALANAAPINVVDPSQLTNVSTAQPAATLTELNTGLPLDCNIEDRSVTKFVDEVALWAAASNTITPGLIISTSELANGIVSGLPVGPNRRSKLTISTQIPNKTIEIIDSNSATLQQSVADLAQRVISSNVNIPATISYQARTFTSANQFAGETNLSLNFANKFAGSSLNFGSNNASSGADTSKYLFIQLTQPMYTVSLADDVYITDSDFFGNLTLSQYDAAVKPQLSDPNLPPSFISSVTYGRQITYIISITSSESDSEIMQNFGLSSGSSTGTNGAISVGGTTSADAALSLNNVQIHVLGGDQNTALNALKTGDFSVFFNAPDPLTAVPLAFSAKHISASRPLVAFRSSLTYTVKDCFKCTKTLATKDIILPGPRVNAPDGASPCNAVMTHPPTIQSCGANATRVNFSYRKNRWCTARFTTSDPKDCSISYSGEDKRSGLFQGNCEVVCAVDVVARQILPNQPPQCRQ